MKLSHNRVIRTSKTGFYQWEAGGLPFHTRQDARDYMREEKKWRRINKAQQSNVNHILKGLIFRKHSVT